MNAAFNDIGAHLPNSSTSRKGEKEMILATTRVEDFDRFLTVFSQPQALENAGDAGPGAQSSFATPIKPTRCGWSSTGMRKAGKASSQTPKSRRS